MEDAEGWASAEHWVRIRSVESTGGEMLDVKLFSFGEVQQASLSRKAFGRIYFEVVFGTF